MTNSTQTPLRSPAVQNAARARELSSRGLLEHEICQQMGVPLSTVSGWLHEGKSPRSTALNRPAWLAWLKPYLSSEQRVSRVNDQPLSDSHVRALFRWQHESSAPGFYAADEFCSAVKLPIDMFFAFCENHKISCGQVVRRPADDTDDPVSPWADGAGPVWHHADET